MPPDGSPLAARLTAQLLAGPPARDPVAVAERLLAVQAQDPRGARLAIRARTDGPTAHDVDRALTQDRSLVVSWLNRGTLHLVRREDYPWLLALTAPTLRTANARRLAQEGVSPDETARGVGLVERALADEGPLSRRQLAERLAAAGVPTGGQALVHVLFAACLDGLAVRGPMAGRQHAYALVRDWLGPQPTVERDRALAELARRYLSGHGPASDRDLARWAGLPLRDARAGLAAIAGSLAERQDGLVDLAGRAAPQPLPPPRLLGTFEPVLLGWSSRRDILGDDDPRAVGGGIFRAIAIVRGRAVATWAVRDGAVGLEPFRPLAAAELATLEADGAAVLRYLGLEGIRRSPGGPEAPRSRSGRARRTSGPG
jgi:Winged helix DNA-binding domain